MQCQQLVLAGDAHLGRGPAEPATAFLEFLDAVPGLGDGLLLTGDLFEFWFVYGRVIPRHGIRIVAALATLARRLPIVVVGGNHDRWAGSFWEQDLGIAFSPAEARFTVGAIAGVALHGDGITETHWSASVLSRILRHQSTVALYRTLHPDFGMWLVDHLSHYLGDRKRSPDEVTASSERQSRWAAERLAREPGLGIVAMGHTHRPAAVEVQPGRWYLNPGAWFDGGRYATFTAGRATLHQFLP